MTSAPADPEPTPLRPDREMGLSGQKVVAGMFAFAITIIVLLFAYWHFYTRPFREVQVAIAKEFPNSLPQVIGGKHKSHQAGARAELRIVVRVDYDPNAEVARSEEIARRLVRITDERQDISKYEVLEVILVHRVPEQESQHWNMARPIAEWRAILDRPDDSSAVAPAATPPATASPPGAAPPKPGT